MATNVACLITRYFIVVDSGFKYIFKSKVVEIGLRTDKCVILVYYFCFFLVLNSLVLIV